MPALLEPGDKANGRVVAAGILLVDLVGHGSNRVDGDGFVSGVQGAGVNTGGLQKVLVVVERAGVGVEGQSVGLALELRFLPREVEVAAAQARGAVWGQVLEHACGCSFGDGETVEHVDVGAGPAAHRGGQLGDVGFRAWYLNQLHAGGVALLVEGGNDVLEAVRVRWGVRCPERGQRRPRITARKRRSGPGAAAGAAGRDHQERENQGSNPPSRK